MSRIFEIFIYFQAAVSALLAVSVLYVIFRKFDTYQIAFLMTCQRHWLGTCLAYSSVCALNVRASANIFSLSSSISQSCNLLEHNFLQSDLHFRACWTISYEVFPSFIKNQSRAKGCVSGNRSPYFRLLFAAFLLS